MDKGLSAKSLKRPSLRAALTRLDRRRADMLMAARLHHISRSLADFFLGGLDWPAYRGRGVLLSPYIDTADPTDRFTANVFASTE